eukprot:6191146-Pleurochrysis_carterae.AAC.2
MRLVPERRQVLLEPFRPNFLVECGPPRRAGAKRELRPRERRVRLQLVARRQPCDALEANERVQRLSGVVSLRKGSRESEGVQRTRRAEGERTDACSAAQRQRAVIIWIPRNFGSDLFLIIRSGTIGTQGVDGWNLSARHDGQQELESFTSRQRCQTSAGQDAVKTRFL